MTKIPFVFCKNSTKTYKIILKTFCYFWVCSKPPPWQKKILFIIFDPFRFPDSHCRVWNKDTNIFLTTGTSFHFPSSLVKKEQGCTSEYMGISWVQMNCYYNVAISSNVQEKSYYHKANTAIPPKNSLTSKLFTHIIFFLPMLIHSKLFCSHLQHYTFWLRFSKPGIP